MIAFRDIDSILGVYPEPSLFLSMSTMGVFYEKILTIGLVSLGLVSGNAFSGTYTWIYETSKHNIKITCSVGQEDLRSENCTYQSWNKPKRVGQGKPDLQIKRGSWGLFANGDSEFEFKTGNVKIEMFDELRGYKDDYLDVYINGRKKDHYRLTEVDHQEYR